MLRVNQAREPEEGAGKATRRAGPVSDNPPERVPAGQIIGQETGRTSGQKGGPPGKRIEGPDRYQSKGAGPGLPEVESRKALDLYSIPSGGILGSL